MSVAFRFGQQVIVTPPLGEGAPYAARYVQIGQRGSVYVRGPQGLHEVQASTVTPCVLGLGDDKAVRHGVQMARGRDA